MIICITQVIMNSWYPPYGFDIYLVNVKTREDKTIESAAPFPAPFAGGSSGSTPFNPCQFIDALPPEWPRSLA